MKRSALPLTALLCLSLLTACGGVPTPGSQSPSPTPGSVSSLPPEATPATLPTDSVTSTYRVVQEDDGSLLLARSEGSGDIVRMQLLGVTVTRDGGPLSASDDDVEEGDLLEITHSAMIQETFPASFAQVYAVNILTAGHNDLCDLYLDVLDDLWETDKGLNSDITQLGVDLSGTRLSPSEQAAVAWAFGEEHGITPIQGTYEALTELGYITTDESGFPYWKDGCLFSITESDDSTDEKLCFDAKKWHSGLGAYFFKDCKAKQDRFGEWSDYTIGAQAIS